MTLIGSYQVSCAEFIKGLNLIQHGLTPERIFESLGNSFRFSGFGLHSGEVGIFWVRFEDVVLGAGGNGVRWRMRWLV